MPSQPPFSLFHFSGASSTFALRRGPQPSWPSQTGWLFLFLPIPRVAGLMRNMPLHVSDSGLPSELEHRKIDNPIFDYFSSRLLGHSLDLNVPGNVSLLKVHGHRRPGTSLYGICVDCNRHHGRYWTVNLSGNSSESTPSCLFSLALEVQPTSRSVELYGLYDGLNVSYGEYDFPGQRNTQPDISTGACEIHLPWREHHDIFSRQTDSTQTGSTQCRGSLGGKMNVMIGLIAALITIVVIIFIVTVLYALRLRTKEKLRRLEQGSEQDHDLKGTELRGIASGKTGSETLIVNPETAMTVEKGQGKLPAEGYTEGQATTSFIIDHTSSSFSTRTQADATKRDPSGHPNPETSTITSNKSRYHGIQPPTSPPQEPIPPLPDFRPAPSRTPIHDLYGRSSAASSPTQLRGLKVDNQHFQSSPAEGSQRSQGTSYIKNTSERIKQRHLRNESSSDSSLTSYETRAVGRPRPFSKQLPLLPPSALSPKPLPEALVIDPPARAMPPISHQPTDRSSWSNSRRQPISRLAPTPVPMQPIRESSLGSNSDAVTSLQPQQARPSPKSSQERTRSAEDIREQARPQIPVLREARSSPGLEQSRPFQNVRLGTAPQYSQAARSHDDPELALQVESQRKNREAMQASREISYPQMRLNVELSTGPRLSHLFSPSYNVVEPPGSLEVDVPYGITETTRPQMRARGARQGNDVGAPGDGTNSIRYPRPPLPKLPPYEQVTAPPVAVIAPLSIVRKRELPKPPT